MTGPLPSRNRGRLRALVDTLRDDPLSVVAAALTASVVALATFLWVRASTWSGLTADLAASEATVVAVSVWDVVLLQATAALVVGVVLGVEVVCYRAREALVAGLWSRPPLSTGARWLLVAAGLALFPAGALVGYEQVFPAVAETVSADARWTVAAWGRLAAAVAVASGLAAQTALAAAVLAYGRGGAPASTPDSEPY